MANTPAQLPAHPTRDDDTEDQAVSGSRGSDQADSSGMKSKTLVSKKLRDSARGRQCQIRIPGYCSFDTSKTVLCHGNDGGGTKTSDLWSAFGCFECHEIVDFRHRISEFSRDQIKLMHHDGIERTQKIWLDEGFIMVK